MTLVFQNVMKFDPVQQPRSRRNNQTIRNLLSQCGLCQRANQLCLGENPLPVCVSAVLTIALRRLAGAGKSLRHSAHRKRVEALKSRKIAKSPPMRG